MNELTKLEIKRQLTKLWNEFKIFLEYLIRMPFIEFKALFKELYKVFNKPVLAFYLVVLYTSYLLQKAKSGFPISKTHLLGMVFLCLLMFIWVIISSNQWKKYYKEKYF